MTDKNTIEQLRKLKSVTPDSSWKEESRRVLFSQVSNSYIDTYRPPFRERARTLVSGVGHMVSKPVWAVIIAVLLIGAGGVFAQPAYNSRPGDTLYFAKKITQKIRLALVFDEKDKARMNIRFASNHARDITEVLSDSRFSDKRLAQELQSDFKEEMDSVKSDLRSITEEEKEEKEEEKKPEERDEEAGGSGQKEVAVESETPARENEVETEEEERSGSETGAEEEGEAVDTEEANEDNRIFGAEFGKDGEGKDINIPEEEEDATTDPQQEQQEEDEGMATTNVQEQIEDANQKLENKKENVDDSTLSELYALLDEAGAEFEQGEYVRVKELLNEFSEKVDNIGSEEEQPKGEVKGKEATSTDTEATSTTTATSSPEGDTQ